MKFSMICEAQLVDTSRKAEHPILQESVEQAVRAEQMGADEIMFPIQLGTLPQSAALETIRNLGEKPIPELRG